MKLYEYQKELLNCEETEVAINWCRCAGKNTALAQYIIENKPNKVAYIGFAGRKLKDVLGKFQLEYNFFIESINMEDFKLIFNTTEKELLITIVNENELRGIEWDLIIDNDDFSRINLKDITYKKFIKVTTENDNKIKKIDNFNYITVDYKRMIKAEPSLIDIVSKHIVDNPRFFREFALLDKPKDKIDFKDFSTKALQKLQKQFLSIPDTKDTVLTRKNIIEMIKDLMELNK